MPCVVKIVLIHIICCTSARFRMVVNANLIIDDLVFWCSTARFRMVVNASGTGVLYANE